MKTLRSKILQTCIAIGAYGIPYIAINEAVEYAQRNVALTQFNPDSAYSFESIALANLTYINIFIFVVAVFNLIAIWKPKTK
jgi:hypothetical protein